MKNQIFSLNFAQNSNKLKYSLLKAFTKDKDYFSLRSKKSKIFFFDYFFL